MKQPTNHILHIEDSEDFQFYIETMLEDVVTITSVTTIKEAREALIGIKFSLFLVDLFLPDGTGSRMAKELKEKYPDTPIVMLSAHDVVTDFDEEVDAIFVKTTLDLDALVKKIKSLLKIA